MSNNAIELFLNELTPMLKLVDEVLEGRNDQGCYQVPSLIGALSSKLGWDADQARRNDPIVRAYLKSHPTWYITRGAHGGIMKRSEYQKKEDVKAAKERAKQEIKVALAAQTSQPVVSDTVVQSDTVSE